MILNKNNLSKVELNHPYKRQELCLLLEVENKTGKAQILQDKEFKQYFDYYTIGNKKAKRYVITKIYTQNQITKNKKKSKLKNTKFQSHLQILIAHYLSLLPTDTDYTDHITTYERLSQGLGVINKHFYSKTMGEQKENIKKKLMEYFPDSKKNFDKYLNEFKFVLYSKLKDIIKRSLSNLSKMAVLKYEEIYVITTGFDEWHIANPQEKSYILKAEKYALKQTQYNTIPMALKYDREKYYNAFNSFIAQEYEWQNVQKAVQIITTPKLAKEYISEYTTSNLELLAKDYPKDKLTERINIVNQNLKSSIHQARITEINKNTQHNLTEAQKHSFGEINPTSKSSIEYLKRSAEKHLDIFLDLIDTKNTSSFLYEMLFEDMQ